MSGRFLFLFVFVALVVQYSFDINFRCSRLDGPGKDFVAIWIPAGLSSGLLPICDPLTFVPLCDHEWDWHLIGLWLTCLKKNQNAPRPSEHPPVRGEK